MGVPQQMNKKNLCRKQKLSLAMTTLNYVFISFAMFYLFKVTKYVKKIKNCNGQFKLKMCPSFKLKECNIV